ncbi:MAG: response regulator transcription factor [Thermoleophilia bacterium]|nr:response regulator transcription factor [Thermoleophilia bacterium]
MATGGHILVVDDERAIRRMLRVHLDNAGYTVTEASDGAEALAQMRSAGVDLVLLDQMMPVMDGLEACRRIRHDFPGVPVIMLSARDDEASRITGLEMGADDYVVKPFSPRELVARIRAVLRRVQTEADPNGPLRAGAAEIHPLARACWVNGTEVDLTRLEFDLLAELAAHPHVVFTRERLLERVWGYQSGVGGKTVDVHIANLRRKLGTDVGIVAVRGVGYRLDLVAPE